ncbi:unnamed protein product [Oreochromis niloticus]|nr:unnamed protein product [Mustela putorius furo]
MGIKAGAYPSYHRERGTPGQMRQREEEMNPLEWILFFICVCFKVTQTKASSWTTDVPSSVTGLRGSCVVIPCSYDYPAGEDQKVNVFTGIWKTTERDQVIYHPTESKILEQHRRRTNLVGNIREKNCSLMIQNLQEPDGGSFYFRIELKGYANFSYLTKKVVISVTDEPNPISLSMKEEVKEGENVSASCSVSHSCPTYPPDFHWSHSGERHDQTQKLHEGQWNSTSTLTFRSNRTDHNKPLQCSVTYHGGKQREQYKIIKIKYAPDIKTSSKCSSYDGIVTCECIIDSEPPSTVLFVLGDKVLQSSKVEKNGSVTTEILQVDFGSFKFVHCLANNMLGNANLMLSLSDKDNMQIILIASGAGVILLIILIATGVGVEKWTKKSGATQTSDTSTMRSDGPVELRSSAPTKRNEDYDNVHCNDLYNSDHVYGNTGSDSAEQVYANV